MAAQAAIYVPRQTGRAAIDELDRAPWAELEHAYGRGAEEDDYGPDPESTLRQLKEGSEALGGAIDELFSNICHQGTIYEATAHAVPFLLAYAAGEPVTRQDARALAALLGSIAEAATYTAPTGSHAGSHGEEVGPLTLSAFRASRGHLANVARRNGSLRELVAALADLIDAPEPTPQAVARVRAAAGREP